MPTTYSTTTLVAVLDGLARPQTFLLDTFFPELVLFDTSEVAFDKLDRARGLAPFVSPKLPGTVAPPRNFRTDTLTPAYVKPKDEVVPENVVRRLAGERFGGDLSPAARRDATVVTLLAEQRQTILRRKEWMASSALRTGAITVAGPDYPSVTVDFDRDAGLTKALTGSARWGEPGVSPLADIEAWADEVAIASGAMPKQVVMDPKAWSLARADPRIADLLDFRFARPTEVQTGPLARGEDQWATNVGAVGQFDFWVYSQHYTDDSGALANFMPAYSVIIAAQGVASGVAGYQAHGFIRDPHATYAPMEFFPRNWISDDPATEWVMTQSAPLVIPARPNASFAATVR